jgi:hypothetical protein
MLLTDPHPIYTTLAREYGIDPADDKQPQPEGAEQDT